MKYQFDDNTGFLITKAMNKLMASGTTTGQNVNIDASQKNSNNKTIINNPKKTRRSRAARNKSNTSKTRVAKNNNRNEYRVDQNRISVGKRGVFGAVSSYLEKRNEKKNQKAENKQTKEAEDQTNTLKDIHKEIKKGGIGGRSKGGFSSIGRVLKIGAIGAGIGLMLKKFITRLGIPGLLYTVFGNYEDEINDFKASLGKTPEDSLTVTEKLRFLVNQVGGTLVSFANRLGAKIDPELVAKLTENWAARTESSFNNFKASYPRFGQAVEDIFTFTNNVLGEATGFIGDGLKKLGDQAKEAFRDKDELETAFMKAKSDRERVTEGIFGDGSVLGFGGHSKEEIAKAEAKEAEIAKKMLNAGGTMSVKTKAEAWEAVNRNAIRNNEQTEERNKPKRKRILELGDKATRLNSSIENNKKREAELKNKIANDDKNKEVYKRSLEWIIKETQNHVNELSRIKEELKTIKIEDTEPYQYESGRKMTLIGPPNPQETLNGRASQHKGSASEVYGAVNEITGKKGGSKAWRNNNPLNITGMGGLRYGAVGIAHSTTGDKGDQTQLVFRTPEDGYQAAMRLYDKRYSKGPIKKTFKKHQTDMKSFRSKLKDLERHGIDTNRSYGSLSAAEKKKFVQIYAKWEGWKKGAMIGSNVVSPASKRINTASPIKTADSPKAPAIKQQSNKKTVNTESAQGQKSNVAQLFSMPIFDEMAQSLKNVEKNTKQQPIKKESTTEEITVNIVNKSTGTTVGGQV